MALVLRVDGDRWRAHLRDVAERNPGLVPVAKGNGYGFGLHRLARKAQWLGVDTIAVGMYEELTHVEQRYDGSLLVLTPWRPWNRPLLPDDARRRARVVHTVSRLEDLADLTSLGAELGERPRVVLERMTSMRRHGLGARELRDAVQATRSGGVRVEGVAMHLPLARGSHGTSHVREVERLLVDVVSAGLEHLGTPPTIWVSHLSETELATLRARYPDLVLRSRIGTGLWLGARDALSVRATVLDAHPVERGDVFGYRGRTAPRAGTILVVSGGTSHGIGLEAPTGEASIRARAASLARGGLDAVGFVRSPYTVGGKQRLFAEPPHMQASMLFLPAGSPVPGVGEEVDVRVRFTATAFDDVVVS